MPFADGQEHAHSLYPRLALLAPFTISWKWVLLQTNLKNGEGTDYFSQVFIKASLL